MFSFGLCGFSELLSYQLCFSAGWWEVASTPPNPQHGSGTCLIDFGVLQISGQVMSEILLKALPADAFTGNAVVGETTA